MPNNARLHERLRAAAAAGLIDGAQVEALAAFLAKADYPESTNESLVPRAMPGEEDLRFIRNFHDVFLATGIVLLAIGLGVTVATLTVQAGLRFVAPLCLAAAAALWALGEIFARQRKLFLPSIAICVSFTSFSVLAALWAYSVFVGQSPHLNFGHWREMTLLARGAAPVAAASGLFAAALFYARFKLPFSIGWAGSFAVLTVLAVLLWAAPDMLAAFYAPIMLACGLALFAAGIIFDMRDPSRATRLSDNGFWLHLAAAPLILNGVLILIGGGLASFRSEQEPHLLSAVVTLGVVALLGLISLLINRRALIVSALFTTGIAVGILMNAIGLDAGALAASTLVVLGAGVLILGAGWHDVRRVLLKRVPATGAWAQIFPPEPAPTPKQAPAKAPA